jgi:phosphatidylinositol dimannoside acyltransferase
VYGVFWVRLLDWGVRRCPFFIEPLLIGGYTLIFFGLAVRQRRAVVENLEVLCPQAGWLGRRARALRVFWEFAWMLVDGARARSGERHVTWRLEGAESFQSASGGGGAALLLTAHMGNYDVAGPFFAEKFGRTVHGVRRPERRAEMQEYMDAQRRAHGGGAYRVRYNTGGGFLGVELAQALAGGEVVAIQGDRVGEGMGTVEFAWRGRRWALPSGPLVLAQVASAPVFPVFIVRDGWRSYRILFLPPRPAAAPVADRAARAAAIRDLTQWWADTLAGVLERYWCRWLMFDPAFASPGAAAAAADPGAVLPAVRPAALPAAVQPNRPERTTPTGWRATLQPISRTPLGRFLNARGLLLPAEAAHQLRAEDSAQNWIEVVVLAGFSALLAAVASWMALASVLPAGAVRVLWLPVWFGVLQLVPMVCGAAAGGLRKFRAVSGRWSVQRLTEEMVLFAQTVFSLCLLATPCRWAGILWLLFAAANGLCFLHLMASRSRCR